MSFNIPNITQNSTARQSSDMILIKADHLFIVCNFRNSLLVIFIIFYF